MKIPNLFSLLPSLRVSALSVLLLGTSFSSVHAATPALVDDFSDAEKTSCKAPRLLITDKDAGGKSQATQHVENGALHVSGDLVPGRGSPAFVSLPLLLTPEGHPQDVHDFTGVRLKVKIERGMVSVQVASTEVTNFDYHLAPVVGKTGEWVEVRVPFKDMKRVWSEQTTLNTASVTSVNLVVVAMAPDTFNFAVDEVGFY